MSKALEEAWEKYQPYTVGHSLGFRAGWKAAIEHVTKVTDVKSASRADLNYPYDAEVSLLLQELVKEIQES